MGKIFCLMGKSSTGKDTVLSYLQADETLGLKPVIPYTSRPKRSNEIEGVSYHFMTLEGLESYRQSGKVIEERCYQTVMGPWYYATIDDGQIDLAHYDYLLITTIEAYTNLATYFGTNAVVPLYIEVEDGVRFERAYLREKGLNEPNYDELCRRYLADQIDFSAENLKKHGIDVCYTNHELETCVETLKQVIRSHRA